MPWQVGRDLWMLDLQEEMNLVLMTTDKVRTVGKAA